MNGSASDLDPQREMRDVVECLPVAACLRDQAGAIVAANAGARALWKREDPESTKGFTSVRKSDGREWAGWPSPANFASEPSCLLVGKCADGSEVEYVAQASIVTDAAGAAAGLLELYFPLSVSTVPAHLVHGLSNALGVILGNVELARDEMSVEYLDEIRNAALHARNLIRQPDPGVKMAAASDLKKGHARLMCIDDDEAFLLLASRAFRRLGHHASIYTSADEALREYSRNPAEWNLIVIDNNLLGREGLEIAREFLDEDPQARICIASGAVDDVLKRRAEKAGVCRVILKPATMQEFADAIGGILSELTPPPGQP
jgi:ActR/RegA family two-component response regulator